MLLKLLFFIFLFYWLRTFFVFQWVILGRQYWNNNKFTSGIFNDQFRKSKRRTTWSKINNFSAITFRQHDIFHFKIPMADSILSEKTQTLQDIVKDVNFDLKFEVKLVVDAFFIVLKEISGIPVDKYLLNIDFAHWAVTIVSGNVGAKLILDKI